jgi:cleavage and polyadenylation specificity factor subunit 4
MRGDSGVPYTPTGPFAIPTDERYHHLGRQPSLENGLPTIDTTYSSNPTSVYGSPRDDDANRFGLGLSPVNKGLSVLDAPLPASFDSNGISHAARYGPWPSSVPSKFGLDSPSTSLSAAKDGRTSETLKLLHTSAFGSSEHLSGIGSIGAGSDSGGLNTGSSPPGGGLSSHHSSTTALGGDEYFGKRTMHSSSLRYAKPRLLSSSAPKIDRDWEPEFLFEEDYVPGALANELLTPTEKARRGSNTTTTTVRASDGTDESPIATNITTTKFGSPATAASPSRWGPLFQRQKEEEQMMLESGGAAGSFSSRSAKASAFGHVGSPLRNSSLASGLGELSNGRTSIGQRPGSGSLSSESLSVLTQQLQRTRLGAGTDLDSPGGATPGHLHPHHTRAAGSSSSLSGLAVGAGKDTNGTRDRERVLERHVSSGSLGSSSATGRFTTPIDEEDAAFVFSMDEVDEATAGRKRVSTGASHGSGNHQSGVIGSGAWSYAAVAGAVKSSSTSSSSGRANAGDKTGAAAVETR